MYLKTKEEEPCNYYTTNLSLYLLKISRTAL